MAPAVKSCPNNYRVLLIESLHVQHPAQQWMREREYIGTIAICTWVLKLEKWQQLIIRIRWFEFNRVIETQLNTSS